MTRADLVNRLRRAERRMDAAQTDAEWLAAQQLKQAARYELEEFDSREPQRRSVA